MPINQSIPKVIIIAGPAGSGKTTTAGLIAANPAWTRVSEDDFWVRIKAGHPVDEQRTEAEEAIVQGQTLELILEELGRGRNVVLEFILYRSPPQPVIFYRESLLARQVPVTIRLFKPSADAIWERKQRRGWHWDRDEVQQRAYADQQLNCLEHAYFEADWIIDNTALAPQALFERHFRALMA